MNAPWCTSSANRRYASRRTAALSSRRARNTRAPRRGLRASVWPAARSFAFSSSRSTFSSSPRSGPAGGGSGRFRRQRRLTATRRLPTRESAATAAQDLQALAEAAEGGGRRDQASCRGQDHVAQDVAGALDPLDRLGHDRVQAAGLHGGQVRPLGEVLAG